MEKNSLNSKPNIPDKKFTTPVIDQPKQPSVFRQLFAEDIKQAKQHVVYDVVVPGIRDFISTGLHAFIDGIIYGTGGRWGNKKPFNYGGWSSIVNNYTNFSKPSGSTNNINASDQIRSGQSFQYEYDTRMKAEQVFDTLSAALEQYPTVSIADLYDASGKTNYDFTTHNWGWRTINTGNTFIRPSGGGRYMLILPPVEPVK